MRKWNFADLSSQFPQLFSFFIAHGQYVYAMESLRNRTESSFPENPGEYFTPQIGVKYSTMRNFFVVFPFPWGMFTLRNNLNVKNVEIYLLKSFES